MKVRRDGVLETQPVTGPLTDAALRAAPVVVLDDMTTWTPDHRTLTPSTDTTITLPAGTRLVRVTNWDASNRILVKDGAIATDVDATASRIGKAPAADVPNGETFPVTTTAGTIHVRSAAASEITVEAFR